MSLAPHALNTSFEWQPTHGPYRALSVEQARHYDENGFVVLEDVFDADTMAAILAEIDPLEEKTEDFLRTREDGRLFIAQAGAITFTPHLAARSPALREFCGSRPFRDLCHDLIGDDVRLYWDQAVYKKPAPGREFPWHQDNGYTYIEPQRYLTCWVALTEATVENGCPWVVPGLHRRGTLEHWMTEYGWECIRDASGAVPAPVGAGGIVVFSSLTPHRTGPNHSTGVRKAYIVQFAPAGALRMEPDGRGGHNPVPCDAPERQFPVLVKGEAPRT